MNLVDQAVDYAKRFISLPYIWGGDDPMRGFDCSGFVQEVLASVGLDPRGDQTAQALYVTWAGRLIDINKNGIPAGCLVFFGKGKGKVTHVGFSVGNGLMVEFGGGGSRTLTERDAIIQNAYGRIRPISNRKDFFAACDPFGRFL